MVAKIIGGGIIVILGILIILFPGILAWLVGISFIITGLVFALSK